MKLADLGTFLDAHKGEALQGSALVRVGEMGNYTGGVAVVLQIGENLSLTWQSGDIMFCWSDGEHTTIHEAQEIEILIPDLWAA